jgi:hypothetical protein
MVRRVPSKIALFPTAQGQPSEIRLFPMAHQPPVGNKAISDGWPPRPSEISVGPLTVVTPRGPPAAHTTNAHTHTRSTSRAAVAARTRRHLRRPPASDLRRPSSPATCAGRRWMCLDAPIAARSAAAPTPAQRAAAAAPRAARARLCPPPPPSG